jgi:hypothetical protein
MDHKDNQSLKLRLGERMTIKRMDSYDALGFSKTVLYQHGAFLVDNQDRYEVEIISDNEAIIRGIDPHQYEKIIDEFRFYSEHITKFYDSMRKVIKEFPHITLFELCLDQIQPSQFYIDAKKVEMIRSFIHKEEDIIIPVIPFQDRYIALDGHTRLYLASISGWKKVRAFCTEGGEYIQDFVNEAIRRAVRSPRDLVLLSHTEYDVKWNQFCDHFFEQRNH